MRTNTGANVDGRFDTKQRGGALRAAALALLAAAALNALALGFEFESPGQWLAGYGANWLDTLSGGAGTGIAALGMCCAMIVGGADLSAGAVSALSAALAAAVAGGVAGWPAGLAAALAAVAALAAGAALGGLNGLAASAGKVNPLFATLCMAGLVCPLTLILNQGAQGGVTSFANLSDAAGLAAPILCWAVMAAITAAALRLTPFGRRMYAIGDDARAARLCGVRVGCVRCGAYALAGFTAALAGLASPPGGADLFAAAGYARVLDAVAAAALGGASLSGGKGCVEGALLGTLVVLSLDNLLGAAGVSGPPLLACKAAVALVAVLLGPGGAAYRGGQRDTAVL